MARVPTRFALAVTLLTAASCDTSVDTSNAMSGPSADCLEADNHSDLEFIQSTVFGPSCANFTACHKGQALSARGLNLEAGMAAQELINQPSLIVDELGQAPMNLVAPGDPDNSYLVVIMEGTPQNLLAQDADGPVTMPFQIPPAL